MTNDVETFVAPPPAVVDSKSAVIMATAPDTQYSFPIENERDRQIIEKGDANFTLLTWDDLQDIIGNNELSRLSRKPSDLKHYLECKYKYKLEYGGVLPFIIKERLHWSPDPVTGKVIPENPEFFGSTNDLKLVYNDFPYGVEPQIIHVVVWCKAQIPSRPPVGDLTEEARQKINDYVKRTFCDHLQMDSSDVLWFKNWAALQSIRQLEHFHVMLNNPPRDKLEAMIGGPGF